MMFAVCCSLLVGYCMLFVVCCCSLFGVRCSLYVVCVGVCCLLLTVVLWWLMCVGRCLFVGLFVGWFEGVLACCVCVCGSLFVVCCWLLTERC